MSRKNEPVWETLRHAGVVDGPMPDTGDPESPWFVKVLLAFSGWLAALFLLGFVAVGFEFVIKNEIAAIVAGSVLIAAAYAILRQPKNEFFEHMALAASLAGQALMMFGFFKITDSNDELAWTLCALLQAALAWIMPSFVHRVFSACVSAIAFSMAMTTVKIPYLFGGLVLLAVAWLWLNEFRYPRHMKKIQGIGYGLVLAVLVLWSVGAIGMSMSRMGFTRSPEEYWVSPWVGELFASAVTIYVVWQILRRLGDSVSATTKWVAIAGALLLCAVSFEARGITAGLTIILLGFAGSNRVLLGMGIAALLYYVSSYYYYWQVTLLDKAQTLLIVGLVLLAARYVLMQVTRKDREASHA